jgi:hypothetical protein
VQTQSLTSLLIGGVAFDTPTEGAEADPAAAATRFELFGDQATAMKAPERRAIHYVLYFDESVRGLSPGAPVTLLGLPIGEVVSVRLEAGSRKDLKVRARVRVATFPQRFLDVLADPQDLTGGQGDHPGDTAGSHRPPGGARPARAVADGQPAHWSTLRRPGLRSERGARHHRLESRSGGVSCGQERSHRHRGQVDEYPDQAGPPADRRHRQRPESSPWRRSPER